MFTVVVRLGSGSTPVKLSDTLIRIDTSVATQSLTYVLGGNASTTTYAVTYQINGSNHKEGYLSVGDLAQFEMFVSSGVAIPEGASMTVRVITKNGAIKPVDLTTPSAMTEYITYLYP